MESFLAGKCGLEIGGPSPIFSKNRLIPVYDRCRRIDNCNFSPETIWGAVGGNQEFGTQFGSELIAEACNLSMIASESYDFVLASHALEHLANPLQALTVWKRVLVPGGVFLVIVPDKRATFDHRRPFTSFDHIQSDFKNHASEDDLTHLEEILRLHDLGLDPPAGSPQAFRERCLKNASIRAMHHHVFSPDVLVRIFTRLGMKVLRLVIERPENIVVLAQKRGNEIGQEVELHNLGFLSQSAEWRVHDPLRGCEELPS